MGFLRGAIPTLLSAMLLSTRAAAAPVVLDFNTLPPAPWEFITCGGADDASVKAGVLTIDTPSCFEYTLNDPNGVWHKQVSNAKGWAVEARVRIDPSSVEHSGDTVIFWINDHTNMLIVGLTKTLVRLDYPEGDTTALDTTDDFHVIRVVSKLDQVRIYVDGVLKIDHTLQIPGAGTNALMFGDGDGAGYSRSYWDYFWYDVDCGPNCDPGSTCADGQPCDDGDPCTEGDVCAKGVCAGSPVICPAADECHAPGTCASASGCTQPPKPDGTPCSIGVCSGGICTSVTSSGSSSSSSSSSSGATGGSGGEAAGGAVAGDTRLYGRAGCYCGVGEDRDGSPGWLLAGLIAAWGARMRARRNR